MHIEPWRARHAAAVLDDGRAGHVVAVGPRWRARLRGLLHQQPRGRRQDAQGRQSQPSVPADPS